LRDQAAALSCRDDEVAVFAVSPKAQVLLVWALHTDVDNRVACCVAVVVDVSRRQKAKKLVSMPIGNPSKSCAERTGGQQEEELRCDCLSAPGKESTPLKLAHFTRGQCD
jgi:hypothetical protein